MLEWLPRFREQEKNDVNVFMNNYVGLNHTHKQFSFQSPLERREKVFQAKVILLPHDDV